jgi:hypothetical protein
VRVAAEERAPPPPLTHPLYVCVHCRRGWLQHEINLRAQELTEKKKQDKIKSALSKRKREEREAVASGKNPFYLKVGRGSLCMLSMAAIAAYAHCYACCYGTTAQGQEDGGAAGQISGPAGVGSAVQVHGQEAQEEREQGPPLAAHTAKGVIDARVRTQWALWMSLRYFLFFAFSGTQR